MHRSFTVTLTDANTNYNVYDLIKAAAVVQVAGSFIYRYCSLLEFETDVALGANVIRIGDKNLSDTNYAHKLAQAQGYTVNPSSSHPNQIHIPDYYVRCNAAGQTLAILVEAE